MTTYWSESTEEPPHHSSRCIRRAPGCCWRRCDWNCQRKSSLSTTCWSESTEPVRSFYHSTTPSRPAAPWRTADNMLEPCIQRAPGCACWKSRGRLTNICACRSERLSDGERKARLGPREREAVRPASGYNPWTHHSSRCIQHPPGCACWKSR